MKPARQSLFGFPVPLPKSAYTQVRFAPTLGYTDNPDIPNPPGSITSGRNVCLWQNRLLPRPLLQKLASNNVLADSPTGAFQYNDVSGTFYPIITSKATVAYLSGAAWQGIAYVSGTSK